MVLKWAISQTGLTASINYSDEKDAGVSPVILWKKGVNLKLIVTQMVSTVSGTKKNHALKVP